MKPLSYNAPHKKGDPGTKDHLDCYYCSLEEIEELVEEVIDENIRFIIKEVLRKSNGKINPVQVEMYLRNHTPKSDIYKTCKHKTIDNNFMCKSCGHFVK